ncbi:hypothetical protein B0A58_02445 [Flavobacterium branchiophilum NBRC 15030 = ATCC 35035]|uniref:Lipoprotein n=1 Tax=Flavobacterium branchiophilum TaxID=55197 RepID=A0A543G2A0_9FLAO|nr:hypothetical protein [Flavobacterium branchiophilum]OXA80474.1 hypothetical protein B0A58_02445 [Flavobacterium branchiophilum NBRC 15030 = ATCC 35035]TQM40179.1 hypothetical protein BC670_1051 [Flavobacterium branchiophilum]GEM56122.1 hypothetical protein FB1_23430 [Flavobacterium branchiophilum NBRC 15030 = ATCC 35035]
MKKIILSLILVMSLQSCSQKPETMINQNKNITSDNIVEEITKEVKHYSKEPIYGISHLGDYCFFEVFLNGMPVFRNFDNNVPDAFEINNSIFRNGQQKVTYKMYPVGKNVEMEVDYNTLVADSKLKLRLYSYDLKNKQAHDIEYLKYEAPQIEEKVTADYSRYKFAGAGKTYYEGSFDITVDVPYELNPPFADAQDLQKMNQKELETMVLKEYQKIRQIYLNKEKDNIAKLTYERLKDDLVADYATPEKVKAAWNQLNEIIIQGDVEILPVANYKMVFFAGGRLVALFTDDSNPEIRGGNALVCKVKSGEFKNSIFEIKHFLYIPKGETEFKVY